MPLQPDVPACSERQLAAILQGLPVATAVATCDPRPRLLQVNAAFTRMFGDVPAETARHGDWCAGLFPDPGPWEAVLADALERPGHPACDLRLPMLTRHGRVVGMRVDAVVLDECLVLTFTDPGERRSTQGGEGDEGERHRAAYELTENIPAGTYTMVLPPGAAIAHFSFISSRFLEYTGLSREEALSDPMKAFACVHPDDFDGWVRKNVECFERKIPFSEECRLVLNGETRWILAESVPRELPDGSMVWEGVLTDITRRKLAEAELAASEARLRLILDHVPVPMAINDRAGRITFINKPFVRTFGYTRDDLPAVDRWAELAYPDPEYRREVFALWDASVSAAVHGQGVVEPAEFRVVCKDGSPRDVVINAVAIDDLLIVGFLDITSRKRAERELAAIREAERRAEEQHRLELERKLKTSLTASAVAHEINQPLSRILMTSQLVLESEAADPSGVARLTPFLRELRSEAERVVSTIGKMKSLLRNVEGAKESVDLRDIAEAAILYGKSFLRGAGAELRYVRRQEVLAVDGDADQLQIALTNLIRNAIEAVAELPPGKGRIVTVELRPQDGRGVVVVVGDSGPGLGTCEIGDLLLKSSKAKGSGLGLFIAQTTMEHHGGVLEAGRSPLGGAEFRMVFPQGA